MAGAHNIVCMDEGELLRGWQRTMIHIFAKDIKESLLCDTLTDNENKVPLYSRMWFYEIGMFFVGFLWAQQQTQEDGEKVLRVQALYLDPLLPIKDSIRATRRFEKCLSGYAATNSIPTIGFYTRRQPDAFMRRLNRTAPSPWKLDSYVLTRKVESQCTTQK